MANVYTLANAKGGCGKSTVALNLAVCFSRAGYRTLAVDLDQQGKLSAALGADLNKLKLTAHRLLIDDQAEISSFLPTICSKPRRSTANSCFVANCDRFSGSSTSLS